MADDACREYQDRFYNRPSGPLTDTDRHGLASVRQLSVRRMDELTDKRNATAEISTQVGVAAIAAGADHVSL